LRCLWLRNPRSASSPLAARRSPLASHLSSLTSQSGALSSHRPPQWLPLLRESSPTCHTGDVLRPGPFRSTLSKPHRIGSPFGTPAHVLVKLIPSTRPSAPASSLPPTPRPDIQRRFPSKRSQPSSWGLNCPRTTLQRCQSTTGIFRIFHRRRKVPSQMPRWTIRLHRTPTRRHSPCRNDVESLGPATNVGVKRSSAMANSHAHTAQSTVMVRPYLSASQFIANCSTPPRQWTSRVVH